MRPAKVLSGAEPECTNVLLQKLAQAATDDDVDRDQAISRVLDGEHQGEGPGARKSGGDGGGAGAGAGGGSEEDGGEGKGEEEEPPRAPSPMQAEEKAGNDAGMDEGKVDDAGNGGVDPAQFTDGALPLEESTRPCP